MVVDRDNILDKVETLYAMVPEDAVNLSTEPQKVWGRLNQFTVMRERNPNDFGLLALLAGVLMRLDRSDDYNGKVEAVRSLGDIAVPVCEEIVSSISFNDTHKGVLRQSALDVLAHDATGEIVQKRRETLRESFYAVIERDLPEDKGEPFIVYLKDEKVSKADFMTRLHRTDIDPDNRAFFALLFG